MSWKPTPLATALLGFLASSLVAGQNAALKDAGPRSPSPVLAAHDGSPLAAAKSTSTPSTASATGMFAVTCFPPATGPRKSLVWPTASRDSCGDSTRMD